MYIYIYMECIEIWTEFIWLHGGFLKHFYRVGDDPWSIHRKDPAGNNNPDTLWWTNKKPWKITMFNGKIHYK